MMIIIEKMSYNIYSRMLLFYFFTNLSQPQLLQTYHYFKLL